jgi:hypothetical protein
MERRTALRGAACALVAGLTLACAGSTYAQTRGMERRDTARDVKQACKAGDEKTRAECRQGKRRSKQASRQGKTQAAPEAKPPQ